MAVVPQETHLAFDYSVLEVVLMGRYPHLGAFEIEGPRDYAAAREALAATGTAEFEERAFATLSGGEKQRVVIASALAQIASGSSASAPLLLLDEPTAALDLAYQLEIASLLRELRERMPLSIVLSTHDLNFAASLCTSLVLLKEGRVLASGPTEQVLTASGVRELYGWRRMCAGTMQRVIWSSHRFDARTKAACREPHDPAATRHGNSGIRRARGSSDRRGAADRVDASQIFAVRSTPPCRLQTT